MSGEGFKILKLLKPADGLLSSSDYLAEFEAIVTVPRTAAPSAGAVREPVGAVLSTVTVRAALVVWLPATSVVTTRSW